MSVTFAVSSNFVKVDTEKNLICPPCHKALKCPSSLPVIAKAKFFFCVHQREWWLKVTSIITARLDIHKCGRADYRRIDILIEMFGS